MKRIFIVIGVLAIAGVSAAMILPETLWSEPAKKVHTLPVDFGAYVLNVSDGRTMAISVSNELYMLRVKGIDLPQRPDVALEAELNLRTLVFGRNILVEGATLAPDGVYEGDVRVGPDHVAEAQLSNGLATPSGNDNGFLALQESAKANKLGIWSPPPAPEDHAGMEQSAPMTTAQQP